MWRLTVEMEGKRIGSFALKEGETVAGRSRTSDIQVNAPDISRSHAKIVVSGNTVTIENLGKSGTRLEGVPVEGVCEWAPGRRVVLGALAELALERDEGESPADAGSEQAAIGGGDSDAAAETHAADDRTSDEPISEKSGADVTGSGTDGVVPQVGDTREGTAAFQTRLSAAGPDGEGGGHTRAMQTRMVSPEELEALREIELKKVRKRMAIGFAIGLPVLALLVVFRPRTLPPETEIVWPRDDLNRPIQSVEPAPGGGADEGGFDVLIPGVAPQRVTSIEGGFRAEAAIGQAGSVPLRLILQEQTDRRFARISRETMVAEWMEEALRDGEVLSFDRPYARLGFYGFEQGVPFTRVPYQRLEGKTMWRGVACLFRHGQRRYSLLVETPAAERLRAERMLFMRYVKPSIAFERSHWEAEDDKLETATLEDMLTRIRRDLARVAPLTWTRIESLLKSVLVKAVAEDDPAAYREALDMLVDLRERQARWFNSQALARDNARAQGDEAMAVRIAELAKAVFSNTEDYRYFQVRRW